MSESVMIALITGIMSAFCSVVAIIISNEKNNALQDERIKSMKDELSSLGKKVEQHNNFGLQLTELKTRVEILERR